jgi:hypothetical protein
MSTSIQSTEGPLTPEQLQALMHAARVQRAKAIHDLIAAFFRHRREGAGPNREEANLPRALPA